MNRWRILRFFKGFAFFTLAVLLFGMVVMGLWNMLLPEITGVAAITFWQAIGLLLLARILFGNWGGWGRRSGGAPWGHQYRKKWEEKMANMSPEEREKWKAEWRMRCGRSRSEERTMDENKKEENIV